jgi:ankyrin repeat protein
VVSQLMNGRLPLVILLILTALVGIMTSNLPHRPQQLIYLTPQEKQDKALIVAIHAQATERALALLKAGANPNTRGYWDWRGRWDDVVHQRVWEPRRNTDGPTALMLAAFMDDYKTAKALLDHGADVEAVDGIGSSALFCATSYGRVKIAKLFLDHGASIHANQEGDTPIAYALMLGDTNLVRCLINRGMPLNTQNRQGDMPLHVAASVADAPMIRLLLASGADPDRRNAAGCTPLHWVVSHQNEGHGIHISPDAQRQSVIALLEHKANRELRTPQGKTALQMTQELHRPDLAHLLSGL